MHMRRGAHPRALAGRASRHFLPVHTFVVIVFAKRDHSKSSSLAARRTRSSHKYIHTQRLTTQHSSSRKIKTPPTTRNAICFPQVPRDSQLVRPAARLRRGRRQARRRRRCPFHDLPEALDGQRAFGAACFPPVGAGGRATGGERGEQRRQRSKRQRLARALLAVV